jgi:hypothetical protein
VKAKKRPNSQTTLNNVNSTGRIVAGEAPESDDEIEEAASISSAASVSSLASLAGSFSQQSLDGKNQNLKPKEEVKYKSLLHKKLSKIFFAFLYFDLVFIYISYDFRDKKHADVARGE